MIPQRISNEQQPDQEQHGEDQNLARMDVDEEDGAAFAPDELNQHQPRPIHVEFPENRIRIVDAEMPPQVLRNRARRNKGLPLFILRRRVHDGSAAAMCIWGGGGLTVGKVYRKLRYLDVAPLGVRKRKQKNGEIRIDAYLEIDLIEPTIETLQRISGWRVRRDLPIGGRPRNNTQRAEERISLEELTMLTFNISGFNSKATNFEYLLECEKPLVVALQETNRTSNERAIRINGYSAIESLAKPEPQGCHGLVLAVRKNCGFTMEALGEPNDYACFGLLKGTTTAGSRVTVVVASVYVATGPDRRQSKHQIMNLLQKYCTRYQTAYFMVGGDWNMTRKEMKAFMRRSNIDGVLAETSRDPTTFCRRNGVRTEIDHVWIRGGNEPKKTILRNWDLSDHFPVESSIKLDTALQMEIARLAKFRRGRFPGVAETIVHANRWEVLRDLPDSDVDALALTFVETAKNCAQEAGVYGPAREKKRKLPLRKKTRKAIRDRGKAFKEVYRNPSDENLQLHEKLAKEADVLVREDKKRAFCKYLRQQWLNFGRGDNKAFWSWITSTSGYKQKRSAAFGLVDPENGEICTDPARTARIWETHFGALAMDISGNSRRAGAWEFLPVGDEMDDGEEFLANADLTWIETLAAIQSLGRGKAAGIDEIPAEFFRMTSNTDDALVPTSEMAQAVWKLVKAIWECEQVPESWETAVMVPIPKKGDLTQVNNYRGISLMPVGLKIVSTILVRRIQSWAERHGKLDRGQAGFRAREEAVGQVGTLYEICRRRQIHEERTFLMFVDLAKAYDKVPHEALLRKLRVQPGLYAKSDGDLLFQTACADESS